MNEKDKMLKGDWYDANYDRDLIKLRIQAQDLCFELNNLKPSLVQERSAVAEKLFGYLPQGGSLISPFICDYGSNIILGENVHINAGCFFMDGAKITVGDNVFIGPYCGFYTASHPLDFENRNKGLEKALPITIGSNCWFGANVSVMPGVTIGSGCVIAAGSVVTKDIPHNSLAAGVPAKVIKEIDNK